MTDNQKSAARLRLQHEYTAGEDIRSALLAGAQALEGRDRWYVSSLGGQAYLIPCDRLCDWTLWLANREPGEYTAIVPEWAKPVPDDLVITGVELR